MKKTQDMLAKHHRDGETFAEMMKSTFHQRFDDRFWSEWRQFMEPLMPEQATVLDLGAGPGMFLRALAEKYPTVRAIGVEVAAYMLEAAGELPSNCEIIAADLHDPHLLLETGSVDVALASVVLHEMNQPVRMLQETHRCLKSGGRLYILDWVRVPLEQYLTGCTLEVFNRDVAVDELDDLFIHFIEHNRFTADDLDFLLKQTGFRVVDKTLLNNNQHARFIAEKV